MLLVFSSIIWFGELNINFGFLVTSYSPHTYIAKYMLSHPRGYNINSYHCEHLHFQP
jgi:hypothetical protein